MSLPRSGSSWLQRELCRYADIASAPEPWFLLAFAAITRQQQIRSPYSSFIYTRAEAELHTRVPDYDTIVQDAMRAAADRVYARLAQGAPFFLDKTPRYLLILPQIIAAFPDARFIFLLRDPAEVASSILRTWGGRWNTLFRYRVDFDLGLANMAAATPELGDRLCMVHYADLLRDQTEQVGRIAEFLGLRTDRTRPQADMAAMLDSDLIGDQVHKSDAVQRPAQMSRGGRALAARYVADIADPFWQMSGYDRQASVAAIRAQKAHFDPLADAGSAVLRMMSRYQMLGAAEALDGRVAANLGKLRHHLS